jgi:hypothetical protein
VREPWRRRGGWITEESDLNEELGGNMGWDNLPTRVVLIELNTRSGNAVSFMSALLFLLFLFW